METIMNYLFGGLDVLPEIVVMIRLSLLFFVYNFILSLMEIFNGRRSKY